MLPRAPWLRGWGLLSVRSGDSGDVLGENRSPRFDGDKRSTLKSMNFLYIKQQVLIVECVPLIAG